MATFTPESIPDVDEVREGLLEKMEQNRVLILVSLAVAVVGSLGTLAWSSVRRERLDTLRTEFHSIVDNFKGGETLYSRVGGVEVANVVLAAQQAESLVSVLEGARGTDLEPEVLFQIALRHQVAGNDAKALEVLGELRKNHPDAPVLLVGSFDSARDSLVDRVEDLSRRRMEFDAAHVYTPPKADVATVARVETDLGEMKVVFYRDRAPGHVEAFLRTARAGGFNGTQAYNLRRGEYVEMGGGDRTRNSTPVDDAEDDPALALEPEDAARIGIRHVRGMVTSVPLISGDQSDRFAVLIAAEKPEFNAVRTPFGELLDEASRTVADRLASAMTYSQDAMYQTRREAKEFPYTPSRPVRIRRVSVWREGVLAEGHAWDTTRVGTDQPEPPPEGEEPSEEEPSEQEPSEEEPVENESDGDESPK